MKPVHNALVLLALSVGACESPTRSTPVVGGVAARVQLKEFRNPVIAGFHPDPSICRVGDDYYLVTSTFEYFPGVPVFHSKDLVHWRQIGHCLTRESQLDLRTSKASGGIFAPTIRHHDGTFYMVTTHIDRGNFYVTAKDPAGPWSDPIYVDQPGIDPSLFFDDDGKVYFKSNGRKGAAPRELGMYMAEIDLRTGKLLHKPRFLWRGIGGRYPEAPHLYKVDGWYYLMLAEGGTEYGHMVTVARSRKPFGPYEACPHNPILSNENKMWTELQATGHADLVQDHRGNWWVVFLAVRAVGYPRLHHLGRETCLAPVAWKDGWPIVNGDRTADVTMQGPCLPAHTWPKLPVRDEFDTEQLGLQWNFVRNPVAGDWSLSKSKGKLWLRCSNRRVSRIGPSVLPSIVCRRQQHFACRVRALLDFEPQDKKEEAGLRVFQNDSYHYELVVTKREGKRVVLVRRTIGTLSKEEGVVALGDGPVTLEIVADKHWYSFRGVFNGTAVELARGETKFLSTQVAGGFTGVYFGMYAASSAGEASENGATFDWFEYRGD